MTQTNTTQNKEELDKSLWIKIPDWIYIGSKEIEIKYQRPDGEWCISTFSPLEKYELNKELLSQAHQSGIEEGKKSNRDFVIKLKADMAHAIGFCRGLGHPETYLEKNYPELCSKENK
jgi:hypothetical protein